MSDFSVAQREAIRHFAESPSPIGIHGLTIQSLLRTGHLERTHEAGFHPSGDPRPAKFGLTGKGWRKHRQIMASGDGPESLKELFRF